MSEPLLCAAPHCRGRYHTPDCNDGECRGCLPRRAADGLLLCWIHVDAIADDAQMLAELHGEPLEAALTGSSGQLERAAPGHRDRVPNPAAAAMRTEIRHTLVAYCRLIHEERGHALPEDLVDAMGAYVATNAQWLAASDYADEASDELGDLRRRAWRVAYPDGARRFDVAPCPADGCAGTLRAVLRRVDSLLPSALVCTEDDGHSIPADQWVRLGRQIKAIREAAG